MGAIMTKTQTVMEFHASIDGKVFFRAQREDTGEIYRAVTLIEEDWEALGEPGQITMTLEFGDTLNGGG